MGKRATTKSIVSISLATVLLVGLVGAIQADAYTRVVDVVFDRAKSDLILNPWPEQEEKGKGASGFVIPVALEKIPDAPSERSDAALAEWALARGGVQADYMNLAFTIVSNRDSAIQIKGASVKVVSRKEPLPGTHITPLGSGDLFKKFLLVDLDQSDPRLVPASDTGPEWSFPISIGPADTLLLHIAARTEVTDIEWVVDVQYVFEGESKQITMDDHGHPFRLTSSRSATDRASVVDVDGDTRLKEEAATATSFRPSPAATPRTNPSEAPKAAEKDCGQVTDGHLYVHSTDASACSTARALISRYILDREDRGVGNTLSVSYEGGWLCSTPTAVASVEYRAIIHCGAPHGATVRIWPNK